MVLGYVPRFVTLAFHAHSDFAGGLVAASTAAGPRPFGELPKLFARLFLSNTHTKAEVLLLRLRPRPAWADQAQSCGSSCISEPASMSRNRPHDGGLSRVRY